MEHETILNFLIETNYSKLVRRKWNIFIDNSNTYYGVESETIYNTDDLKSNLCD